MSLKESFKKHLPITLILGIVLSFILSSTVFAYQPSELYENVWRLINTKYVDQTSNSQDWNSWRHKYDKYIKTDDDAYVAIGTMVASLDDPYTKFLDPKEFAENLRSLL